jgi:hypothetical protein
VSQSEGRQGARGPLPAGTINTTKLQTPQCRPSSVKTNQRHDDGFFVTWKPTPAAADQPAQISGDLQVQDISPGSFWLRGKVP